MQRNQLDMVRWLALFCRNLVNVSCFLYTKIMTWKNSGDSSYRIINTLKHLHVFNAYIKLHMLPFAKYLVVYPFSQNILCVCAVSCHGYATRILPGEARMIFQPRGPKPFNSRMTHGSQHHMRQKLASRVTVHFRTTRLKRSSTRHTSPLAFLFCTRRVTTQRAILAGGSRTISRKDICAEQQTSPSNVTLNDIARINRPHRPTSPNTAPAMKHESQYYSSHMTRHIHCAEQQASPSNVTKYFALQEKRRSSLILLAYETSSTRRHPPTSPNFAPATKSLRIDPHHTSNVIYIAPSNRPPTPTSPSIAPATKNDIPKNKKPCWKRMKRHLQWWTIWAWSEHDPSIIRTRTRHLAPAPSPRLLFEILETHVVWNITTVRALAIYPKFTKCCPCHDKWHCSITKNCTCHVKWRSSITKSIVPATKSDTPASQNIAPATKSDTLSHSTLSYSSHELHYSELLYSELLLYWTLTLLNCYFTELLLYWAVAWLNCYFTELLLDWTVTLLNCLFTTVSCYLTELLLYWAGPFFGSLHFWISVTRKFLN